MQYYIRIDLKSGHSLEREFEAADITEAANRIVDVVDSCAGDKILMIVACPLKESPCESESASD